MYRLIFYKMDHMNIMDPTKRDLSFSVSIETEEQYGKAGSILEIAETISIDIRKPPVFGCKEMYLEAATLREAHYLCMQFGFTVTGQGEVMRNSTSAEFMGLHEVGTLEEEYERVLNIKKGSKSA